MAMTAGSVSVNDDGTETKSGFAQVVYDSDYADYVSSVVSLPDAATLLRVKRAIAKSANRSALLITYIQANAKARISTSTGQLQQLGGNDTTPPTATRDLPIV